MAMVAGGGGNSRAPLRVNAGPYMPAWMQDETDEDQRRVSVMRQAVEDEEAAASPDVSDALARPSESASIMRSIDKVGGAKGFSQRVNHLSNYWRSKFGVDPEPAFILDLARLELPLGTIKTGLMKSVTTYHRGLATPLQTAEAKQWLKANIMPTGKVSGTKATTVLADDQTARDLERGQKSIMRPVVDEEPSLALTHFNPYWEMHRSEVESYRAKKNQAEQSWSFAPVDVPAMGEHVLTEIVPRSALGALMGLDVRMGLEQQGVDVDVDNDDGRRGGSGSWVPKRMEPIIRPIGSNKDDRPYDQAMSRRQAQALGVPYEEVDAKSNIVYVKSGDVQQLMAMGTIAGAGGAQKLSGILALGEYVYKGLSSAVGAAVKAMDTLSNSYDWMGNFVHGQFEYMWSGHLTTPEQTKGFHMGRYVAVTGPDGHPAYLTASAGMTEEELLQVLDYQGTDYTVNSDGTLTINDPGDSGWWSKLWDGRQAEYGAWLGDQSWGTAFVEEGLRDTGFLDDDDSTWGVRNLTAFSLQMFYWGLGDVVIGGPIRPALTALKVDKLATKAVTKTNLGQTVAHVVANTEDIVKIRAVTGIHDPTVLAKLQGIGDVDGVTKELSTVLQEGFTLDPTSLMVKNQIKYAVASSDGFNKLPMVMQQAFRVMPERTGMLAVGDTRICSTVDAVADSFGSEYAMRSKWMNKIVTAPDRHTRVGYLMEMWDELKNLPENAGHYATAEKRMAKYMPERSTVPPQHTYAPDPEMLLDGKAVEISVRDASDQTVRLNKKLANAEAMRDLLKQMELEGTATADELAEAGVMAADELAFAEHVVGSNKAWIDLNKDKLAGLYDDLISPQAIKDRAKTLRDDDQVRKMDLDVLRALHDLGGFSLKHSDIFNPKFTLAENRRLMHGHWSPNNPYSLWREPVFIKGSDMVTESSRIKHEFDELVENFKSGYPDLAGYMGLHDLSGRKDSDIFFEWIEAHQDVRGGKRAIKEYMDQAETDAHKELRREMPDYDDAVAELELRSSLTEDYLAQIKAHREATERGVAYQPFQLPAEAPGLLSASKRAQELDAVEARIRGIRAEMEEVQKLGTANVGVPLHPYQEVQYFHPPIDLDLLSTTFAGKAAQALDSLQRGVVITDSSKVSKALPGVLAGGVAGSFVGVASQAAGQSDTSTWTAAGITAALAGGLGFRGSMKWAKHAETEGVKGMTKITPNLDYLTSLWKRYALGSVGVLFRVAGDEPARMASQGYGWDAVMAWFRNSPVQKQMMRDAWYQGPYSYEKGMTQLSYLFNNVYPNTHVVFMPNMDGWDRAFRTSTRLIQSQPTTKVVMRAFKEGEDPRIALGRWYKSHPDTAKSLTGTRGTDLETLIDQEVEYLTKFTHRRMKSTGTMGVLDDTKKAEWAAYQDALRAGTGATPPKWFNPVADVVLDEGRSGNLVHLRRNSQLYGFLSGDVKLTPEEIAKLAPDERPIINARRKKGSLFDADGTTRQASAMNFVDKQYDHLYGTFDAVMRNVRTNIYLREYKREADGLRELALKRSVDVDEDVLHNLADQAAQRKVDFMTYTSQRTGLENLLRDVVPFMPATRDFLAFWAAESFRKPTRFASYLRLNQGLPDEVQVSYDEDTLGGLGRILTHLTHADSFTFNPRALSFFTGGATMSGGAETEDQLWKLVDTQFPGFGPMVTMPAHYFAASHPDQFGFFPSFFGLENSDLTKVPGMDLVQKSYPLFSRAERLVWAAVAVGGWALSGLDPAQGYDTAQTIVGGIPWLSRDKEARDRMVDLELEYVYSQEAKAGRDLGSLTDEEKYELLQKAKAVIMTREGATGFLGFISPAIPYFHDREQEDIRAAISAYRDTYQDWKQAEEGDERTGWLTRSRADAQREQGKLREKYREYEYFFDYVDAMATYDEEKFDAVGAAHPDVVAYFTSIYNNHADVADYVSLDNYDDMGIDGWISARILGLKPVKDPAALGGELSNVYANYQRYTQVSKSWADFKTVTASLGLREGDQEYETAKSDLFKKQQQETGKADPKATYRNLGWVTPEQLGIAPDPAAVAWKKEQGALLAAEMEARIADVTTANGKAAIKAEFIQRCEEEGIDPKVLSGSTEYLPAAERRLNELVREVNRNPWEFTIEELPEHGIEYDYTFLAAKAKVLDAQQEVNAIVKKYGGNIWNAKYDSVRQSYFEYVRTQCDTSESFAQFWDYYQAQDWEKMQATGRYESETWQSWFDALAQRDNAIAQAAEAGIIDDVCSMTGPSKKLASIVDQLKQFADDLCAEDPEFAQAFKTISWSFWDKVRRW